MLPTRPENSLSSDMLCCHRHRRRPSISISAELKVLKSINTSMGYQASSVWMMSPHVALASLVTVANLAKYRAMKSKSLIAAVSLQRKPEAKRVSDGDVIVAGIWLALYLLMIVGALFVNRNGFLYDVPLLLFAAVLGGWGVLGWRRKKKADHTMKSRKLFTYVSPKNLAPIALSLFAACAWSNRPLLVRFHRRALLVICSLNFGKLQPTLSSRPR